MARFTTSFFLVFLTITTMLTTISQATPTPTSPSEITFQRQELWAQVNELFNCRPTEDIYSLFTPDAEFEDPICIAKGLKEIKAQFNGMAKLFKGAQTLGYSYIKEDIDELWVDVTMEYNVPIYGKKVMHSNIVIKTNDFGQIVRLEDRWGGKLIPSAEDGFFARIAAWLRRANGKILPIFVKPGEEMPLPPDATSP